MKNTWTCSYCRAENKLNLDSCSGCGARREDSPQTPEAPKFQPPQFKIEVNKDPGLRNQTKRVEKEDPNVPTSTLLWSVGIVVVLAVLLYAFLPRSHTVKVVDASGARHQITLMDVDNPMAVWTVNASPTMFLRLRPGTRWEIQTTPIESGVSILEQVQ